MNLCSQLQNEINPESKELSSQKKLKILDLCNSIAGIVKEGPHGEQKNSTTVGSGGDWNDS